MAKSYRPDRDGNAHAEYKRNREKIIKSQSVCAICGQPVDKTLSYPHPMSATVDHIIPVARGGHPSDISNLQLAHWICNRQKSDKLQGEGHKTVKADKVISNRLLPQVVDWTS